MFINKKAKEAGERNLKEVQALLEDLNTALGKYQSLEDYQWNWPYVGDLRRVKEQLHQVHEFIA